MKAGNSNTSDAYPKVELDWSKYTDKKVVGNSKISGGITGFFNTTITNHLRLMHKTTAKPTCLMLSKTASEMMRDNPRGINYDKYSNYYLEEGGSDQIDVESPTLGGELENLKDYQYHEDYNYFVERGKKDKKRRKDKNGHQGSKTNIVVLLLSH